MDKKYSRAELVNIYFNKVDTNEIEISELRGVLNNNNIEESEIDIIIPIIDRKILRSIEIKADNNKGKNMFYGGLILCLCGLILTLGTYFSLIDMKGFTIIAYGPILGGLSSAMIGKAKMNRDY